MQCDLERSRRLYQTLQLPDFSTVEVVRQAYKVLALKYHPDKNLNDPSAAEKFRSICIAYEILSNIERKRKYDSMLRMHQPLGPSPFVPGLKTSCTTPSNVTSNIYEELSTYASKKAQRRVRTPSVSTPRSERPSLYTKEQKVFFKKREKEHQAELRKRCEQEKREQRERELEKLRHQQLKREEAQQIYQMHRAVNSARRSHSSSMRQRSTNDEVRLHSNTVQRGSSQPPVKAATPAGVSAMKILGSPVRSSRIHASAEGRPLPRTGFVRETKNNSSCCFNFSTMNSEHTGIHEGNSVVLEVRQSGRRSEPERSTDFPLRQRVADTLQLDFENRLNVIVLNERNGREQVVVPQEAFERRKLFREYEHKTRHLLMEAVKAESRNGERGRKVLGRVRVSSIESVAADIRVGAQFKCTIGENNRRGSGVDRAAMWRGSSLANGQSSPANRRCSVEEAPSLSELDELMAGKRLQHLVSTGVGVGEESKLIACDCNRNDDEHLLDEGCFSTAFEHRRNDIMNEEDAEWNGLLVLIQERLSRCELEHCEKHDVLRLIKCRANERQALQLANEERARLVERESSASTILALQMSVRKLERLLCSFSTGGFRDLNHTEVTGVLKNGSDSWTGLESGMLNVDGGSEDYLEDVRRSYAAPFRTAGDGSFTMTPFLVGESVVSSQHHGPASLQKFCN
ncbi:DnaJ domain [Trypanosoma vivax]|uniref:Putative chaperone DNAJ-like protein n=1 Tax=Trypanosoma vivax (strain Y486) TaxID=1055687 RepID=G0U423_TRYVY|nr:putative chaperone DNAJ-like protein [Trypanosoma vivax]KAH8612068.1 DnaJ domain [Trypanosoma vivax]CCC52185.1 putative chaperone DNAJ-like protein [Trypanosoma vivax Y486]